MKTYSVIAQKVAGGGKAKKPLLTSTRPQNVQSQKHQQHVQHRVHLQHACV